MNGCNTCGRDPLTLEPEFRDGLTDETKAAALARWREDGGLYVYALPGFPMTLANCYPCFVRNAYPEWLIEGWIEQNGSLEGCAEWFRESDYWDTTAAEYRKVAAYVPPPPQGD